MALETSPAVLHAQVEFTEHSGFMNDNVEQWYIYAGQMMLNSFTVRGNRGDQYMDYIRNLVPEHQHTKYRPRASSRAGHSSNVPDNCGIPNCPVYLELQRRRAKGDEGPSQRHNPRRSDHRHRRREDCEDTDSLAVACCSRPGTPILQPADITKWANDVTPSDISPLSASTFSHASDCDKHSADSQYSSDQIQEWQAKAALYEKHKAALLELGHFTVQELQDELKMEREQLRRAVEKSYEEPAFFARKEVRIKKEYEEQIEKLKRDKDERHEKLARKYQAKCQELLDLKDRHRKTMEDQRVLLAGLQTARKQAAELQQANAGLGKELSEVLPKKKNERKPWQGKPRDRTTSTTEKKDKGKGKEQGHTIDNSEASSNKPLKHDNDSNKAPASNTTSNTLPTFLKHKSEASSSEPHGIDTSPDAKKIDGARTSPTPSKQASSGTPLAIDSSPDSKQPNHTLPSPPAQTSLRGGDDGWERFVEEEPEEWQTVESKKGKKKGGVGRGRA